MQGCTEWSMGYGLGPYNSWVQIPHFAFFLFTTTIYNDKIAFNNNKYYKESKVDILILI